MYIIVVSVSVVRKNNNKAKINTRSGCVAFM